MKIFVTQGPKAMSYDSRDIASFSYFSLNQYGFFFIRVPVSNLVTLDLNGLMSLVLCMDANYWYFVEAYDGCGNDGGSQIARVEPPSVHLHQQSISQLH